MCHVLMLCRYLQMDWCRGPEMQQGGIKKSNNGIEKDK